MPPPSAHGRPLVVTSYAPFPIVSGGGKRQVRLMEAIERAGGTPHLLTYDPKAEAVREVAARGWTIEGVPWVPGSLSKRLRLHVRRETDVHSDRLEARIAELSRDAPFVQFEEIRFIQYAGLVPKATPCVVSLHNVDSLIFKETRATGSRGRLGTAYQGWRMSEVEKRAVRRADAVLAVSEHDQQHFERVGGQNVLLVPNGVDEQLLEVPEQPSEEPRLLFFGTFAWRPNRDGALRFLEEVWPLVLARRSDARLRIAGPRSEEFIGPAAAGLQGVEVLGFVDDLPAELAASRAAVAAVWAGGGTRIKVLEALAAARPVIGTAVGVERVGFEHGVHGLVADDPAQLAECVLRVLERGQEVTRMAHAARRLGRRYLWTEMTKPAAELYRQWLHPV